MRRLLLCVAMSVGVMTMPALAQAQPGSEVEQRVYRLQAMHTEAQRLIDVYNSTRDATQLASARDYLAQWVVEHTDLYGEGADASNQRASVERQLGMVEAELRRVAPTLAPTPAPAPTVAPVTTASPMSPMVNPVISIAPAPNAEQTYERQKAARWNGAGFTFAALGGATLLGATIPLWVLHNQALERANEQRFYVDEQRFLGRARRRQVAAYTTLGVGISLTGIGLALIAKGTVHSVRARRLAWSPQVGRGFAGVSTTVRF
ncbi:MAG: hypothetical protein K0V04_39225 [Deltaproteobacteria bacterium]|nr:hypothetical protein [Deltaproteobacteria bacterium]